MSQRLGSSHYTPAYQKWYAPTVQVRARPTL